MVAVESWTRSLTQVFAKARLLEASEGRSDVRLVVGVDEHGAGVEPLADVQSLADVPGENPGRQAVLCGVGSPQDVVHLPEQGEKCTREKEKFREISA